MYHDTLALKTYWIVTYFRAFSPISLTQTLAWICYTLLVNQTVKKLYTNKNSRMNRKILALPFRLSASRRDELTSGICVAGIESIFFYPVDDNIMVYYCRK